MRPRSEALSLQDLHSPPPKKEQEAGIEITGDEETPGAIMLETQEDEKDLRTTKILEMVDSGEFEFGQAHLIAALAKRSPEAIGDVEASGPTFLKALALCLKEIPPDEKRWNKLMGIFAHKLHFSKQPIRTKSRLVKRLCLNYPEAVAPLLEKHVLSKNQLERVLDIQGEWLPKEQALRIIRAVAESPFITNEVANLLVDFNIPEEILYEALAVYSEEEQKRIIEKTGLSMPDWQHKLSSREYADTGKETAEIEGAYNLEQDLHKQLRDAYLKEAVSPSTTPERGAFLREQLKKELEWISKCEALHAPPSAVTNLGEVNAGENMTQILHYDEIVRGAIFKPKAGEKDGLRKYIPSETYYKREWLASQIDRALGFFRVPPTIIRKGPRGIGSAQEWKIGATVYTVFDWEDKVTQANFAELKLFDTFIKQSDRHENNLVLGSDHKLWGIDNGLSFDKKTDRDNVWRYKEHEMPSIPQSTHDKLQRFMQSKEIRDALYRCFAFALGKEDGDYFFQSMQTTIRMKLDEYYVEQRAA